jgi:hypothetical protein
MHPKQGNPSRTQSSGLVSGDFQVNHQLQLTVSVKAVGTASLFNLALQNMLPRPSPLANLVKMPNRLAALAFELCVLYYRNPCTQTFSRHLKDE